MSSQSAWRDVAIRPFAPLTQDLEVDVLVVGGGITGITSAYLIKRAGRTVALIERDRCAAHDTGHTTAHLACVTDSRLTELVNSLGRDAAQATWHAGMAAIDQIEQIAELEAIDCQLLRVPGYLHASFDEDRDEVDGLQRDAAMARELGFDAQFVPAAPHFGRPGVRFDHQAKFHPLAYLAELVTRIPGDGSFVFEQTEAGKFESPAEGRIEVHCGAQVIRCREVVIATHVPLLGLTGMARGTLLQAKLKPYISYAISGRAPALSLPEALFWDTSQPYYYLRVDHRPDYDSFVFGGRDHKTGQVSHTEDRFAELERKLRVYVPNLQVDHRWSGQVIETHDGLPMIGETTPGQFVATGFAGNGMTFGTLAAMMARDWAIGRASPWTSLFDPLRGQLTTGGWSYMRQSFDYPYYMVKDRLLPHSSDTIDDVGPGEAKVVTLDGHRVAVSRDNHGEACCVSAVCTHMGCIVHWNQAEHTWDCPCHGSRFSTTGEVLAGPAESPLEPQHIDAARADRAER